MIIDITVDCLDLIKDLEGIFPSIFTKTNQILNDFSNNIFTKYFIYIEKDNIIGFVHYDYIYDRFEIIDIIVSENYRGKGIGSKLMEELIARAKNENIKNITLEVKNQNCPAIFLYEKYGFKKMAIRKNYYDDTDGILMEKEMV